MSPPVEDHESEYEVLVGLWLNLPRIRFVGAAMTLAGVAAAGHNEALPPIWFDALARFPVEAEELQDATNRARGKKAILSKLSRGGVL